MKNLLEKWIVSLVFGLVVAISCPLAYADDLPPISIPKTGNGRMIPLKGGDLSILAPLNWEIISDMPGLTLLMKAPLDPNLNYQRTIQVASFNGPRYMDSFTAKEFEKIITRKFSTGSAIYENYQIRNFTPIETNDGRPGYLFYADFRVEGIDIMQAHILVSSAQRHYLLSFTDLASHFEGATAGPFLEEAWNVMRSAKLKGRSPERFDSTTLIISTGVGVVLLAGLLGFIRKIRSSQSLVGQVQRAYDDSDPSHAKDREPTQVWTLPDPKLITKGGKKAGAHETDDDFFDDEEAV